MMNQTSIQLQQFQLPIQSSLQSPSKSKHKRMNFTLRPSFQANLPANFIEQNGSSGANEQSHSIRNSSLSFNHGQEISNPTRVAIQNVADRIKSLPIRSEEGTEIFIMSQKNAKIRNISEFNNLFMDFVSEHNLDLALKLLSDISSYGLVPNSRTFSIMIRCYCKKGDLGNAAKVLDQMVERGCNPNDETFTFLVNAFCKRGKMQKALEMVEVLRRVGRKPTVKAYNCLLKGLCYVGRVEEACEMMTEMKKDGLVPDIYTYTALMDGLCKVGRSDEAVELLEQAEENGLKPSVVTYNTLFNGYCKEGRPFEGIRVLNKMKQMNCMPDRISYITLLHGLIKWGKIPAALRTYKEMVSSGHGVDEKMMNTFMRALCRRSWKEKDLLDDVNQVFETMKIESRTIDRSTYGLVISTLCSGNMIYEALENLHHMIGKGYSPRVSTVDVIIQALCRMGTANEALCVLELVGEQHGIPFSRVSFDLIIDELNKRGMWFSACSLYGLALKRGVKSAKRPQQAITV